MTPSLWLSRLQLSDSSQRLLTEAAADWQHEVSTATSLVCVVRAHLFGTVSILRLLPFVIADSAMPAFHWSWLVTLSIWVGAWMSQAGWRLMPVFLVFFVRGIVPLAVLFGPSARRSPAFGFAGVQILASVATAIAFPNISRTLLVQATLGAIVAMYMFDRVRMAEHREHTTLKVVGLLALYWYVVLNALSGLRVIGLGGFSDTKERVLWVVSTIYLAAIWRWLVRRQETRQWWAHLQLWLEYRGERR